MRKQMPYFGKRLAPLGKAQHDMTRNRQLGQDFGLTGKIGSRFVFFDAHTTSLTAEATNLTWASVIAGYSGSDTSLGYNSIAFGQCVEPKDS